MTYPDQVNKESLGSTTRRESLAASKSSKFQSSSSAECYDCYDPAVEAQRSGHHEGTEGSLVDGAFLSEAPISDIKASAVDISSAQSLAIRSPSHRASCTGLH